MASVSIIRPTQLPVTKAKVHCVNGSRDHRIAAGFMVGNNKLLFLEITEDDALKLSDYLVSILQFFRAKRNNAN